ncbi:MAG TPA: hypothetical protein VJN18_01120 [Polyangiaceae bacterium]|nr:hypothetical protein [Polyangiaceae bacterium]
MGRILKDVQVLRKVQRSPEKFDALNVFATWAQRHAIAITQDDAVPRFAEFLQASLQESLNSDTMLFGGRTQAMFEAIVANLGAVKLVKTEDNGDVYTATSHIRVPDTRIVLAEGHNVLVEVKNNHGDPRKPFRVKAAYVDSLLNYAELTRTDLRFAIYWSQMATWTLVAPDALKREGKWLSLDIGTAYMRNDMGALGDTLIGCPVPIVAQMFVQKQGKGKIRFDHSRSRIFVAEREVVGDAQRLLLRFLIFWGGWPMSEPKIIDETTDHRVVELRSMPSEEELEDESPGQGCRMNGFVSTILSRYWLQMTSTLDGDFATLLPSPKSWSDQLLNVTNEGDEVFAIARIKSSLDPVQEEAPTTPPEITSTNAGGD